MVNSSRYKELFYLAATDYEGWALGLKKAGYATDTAYAYRLINMIKRFRLQQYDITFQPPSMVPPGPLLIEQSPPFVQPDTAPPGKKFSDEPTKWQPTAPEKEVSPALPKQVNPPAVQPWVQPGIFRNFNFERPQINLQRLDNMLIESSQGQVSGIPEKAVSGELVITVDPNKLTPTFQRPVKRVETPVAITDLKLPTEVTTNMAAAEPPAPKSQRLIAQPTYFVNKVLCVRYEEAISLAEVAALHHLSVKELATFNDLPKGQTVFAANTNLFLAMKKEKYTGEEKNHRVAPGDNMWTIAQRYGLSLTELYARNYMRLTSEPVEGETILLKGQADYPPKIKRPKPVSLTAPALSKVEKSAPANTAQMTTKGGPTKDEKGMMLMSDHSAATTYHLVREGETLITIAEKYKVDIYQLQVANYLTDESPLQKGQVLLIIR